VEAAQGALRGPRRGRRMKCRREFSAALSTHWPAFHHVNHEPTRTPFDSRACGINLINEANEAGVRLIKLAYV
jgi:hypothetical protein